MGAETESKDAVADPNRANPDPDAKNVGAAPLPPPAHPGDAIRDAFAQFAMLLEFAAYYVVTRVDAIKLTVRRLGITVGMLVIAAVGVSAIVVTAVVLLMRGIAGGLVELFPRYPWLGDLIVGFVFLILPLFAVMIGMRRITRMFKSFTVQKYEARQRQQRQHFGSDVRDHATAAPGSAGKTH